VSPPPAPAEALKAMEKVASHINEMQKIYEDYGCVFDQLVAEQTGHDREVGPRGFSVVRVFKVAVTTLGAHPDQRGCLASRDPIRS